ncbi:MAG TPA: acyl-CoA thioesterase [Chthonomonadaceae bacterium]|nr:acyl-CoA thioesterase [Chthonomonadaceae bacterium]
MPEFKYADETEVRVSQLMTLEWANFLGTVHGGQVLHLVDNIAYVCAARYAGNVCVTAAVDRVDFYEPIYVGELLNLVARINYAGRTSLEVEINVYAKNIQTGKVRHTNDCHLTMVAIQEGKPVPVPRLVCRTREDKARYIQAKMRREMGLRYREERDRFLEQFANMSDSELDTLIAEQQKPKA